MPTLFDLHGIDLLTDAPKPQEKSGLARRALGDTGVSLLKGAVGVPEAMVGVADLVTGGQAGKLAEDLGFRPKEAKSIMDEWYSPEQRAANQEVQQARGFVDTTMAALRNPSTILQSAVESAPSLLPAGAVARGAMAIAPRIGGALAAGIGEGAVSAGQTAEQVRQETADGLLTGEQAGLAAASGALTGAIGAVAGKIANKLGIGDIDQLVAGVQQAGPKAQKSFARALMEGFATEGVLQELPQSAQEQIAQNVALGKPWDEGVGNAAAMGALAGGLMGAGAAPFGHTGHPTVPGPDEAMRKLATADNVGDMIAAAHDLASAPLDIAAPAAAGLTPDQEDRALTAMERQMQADQQAIKFGGGRDASMAAQPAAPQSAAPVAPAEPMAQVVEQAPLLDRIETLKEQISTPEVREALREKLGDDALNQVTYYIGQAGRPGGIDGIPDATRERITSLAESIISRALLQPTASPEQAQGIAPQPFGRQALSAQPAPETPLIGADRTRTGTLRVDSAGVAMPETQLDVINTRQAAQQAQDAKAAAAAEASTIEPQGRRASAVYGEPLPRRPAPPVNMPERRRTEAVELAPVQPENADPVLAYVDLQRQVNTPQARAFVQDFNAGRITRRDVIRVMQSQGQDPLTPEQRLADAASQAPAPAQGIQAAPVYRSRTKATVEARKVGGEVVPVEGGFTVKEVANARPDAAGSGGRGAADTRSGDRAGVLAERAGRPGASRGIVRDADQGVAAGDDGRGRDGALSDSAAHEAATSPKNSLPEPTQAQKEAGNYKVGRIRVAGLDISVENPQGSTRSGVDRDGKAWENTLQHHYGYIRGTVGADKDHVDAFVKPGTPEDFSGQVFVVDQVDPSTGKFDEHKVLIGFDSEQEAREAYAANYAKGWKGLKSVTAMPVEEFKAWVKDPQNTRKPLDPADSRSKSQSGPSMPAVPDIPRDAAYNAHRGTSHVPEERAIQEREGFRNTLREVWERAVKMAGNDQAAIDRVTEVFKDVADGYRSRYLAALGARSRVMSSMIAGPARFPVERNRKRMETERKRSEEARQYLERGIKRLERAARGPVDNSPEAELENLRQRLTEREELQDKMKAANTAIRKGDDAALEDLGFSAAEIADMKKGDYAGRKGFARYELTNNNAEIHRLRERLAEAEKRVEAAAAGPVESQRPGVRIVEDAQDDRLRLFFEDKPAAEVREALKRAAFKWAPSAGAWQRQLTDNARRAASDVLDQFFPTSDTAKASRRADPERAAQRWTRTDRNAAGPEFYGRDVDLIALREFDLTDEFSDDALPFGHTAQVGEGSAAYKFLITDHDGSVLGEAALEVNADGEIEAIHDIEMLDKRAGYGRKVIEAILANASGPVRIIDILDQSEAFWQKMGAGYKDTYGNATADWQSYRSAQGLDPRGSQGARSQADRELEAGRPATGEYEGGEGSGGQDLGPKANRLLELMRGSSGKGFPIRLAELYASKYEEAGLHRVNVARNLDDLPAQLRAKLSGFGDDVRGAYFPSTDQIFVFTDNITSPDELHFVAMHEAFHRGMAAIFGAKGKKLMRQMYASNQRLRDRADLVARELQISKDEAIEEALADMAGEGTAKSLRGWKRLSSLIRDWLRAISQRLGLRMNFTDAQIELFVAGVSRAGINVDPAAQGEADGFDVPRVTTSADLAAASRSEPQLSRTSPMASINQQAIRNAIADQFKSAGEQVSWWQKTLGTQYDKARAHPEFGKVFRHVQQYIEDTSMLANEAADLAPEILPQLESVRDVFAAGKRGLSAADQKAIAAPIFEGTLNWSRQGGKLVKFDDLQAQAEQMTIDEKARVLLRDGKVTEAELRRWQATPLDIYDGAVRNRYEQEYLQPGVVFSPAELQQLFGLNQAQVNQYQQFRAAVNESLDQVASADALRLLGEATPEIRAAAMGDRAGFRAAVEAHLQDRIKNEDDADARDQLQNTLADIVDKFDKVDRLKARGYAPLMRFGKYFVSVKGSEGQQEFFGLYETRAEANRMARELGADEQFSGRVEQGTMSQEAYKLFSGIPVESLEMFAGAIGAEKSQVYQEFLRLTKNNRSALKRLIKRKGTEGFSSEVSRVLASFVTSNARMAAGAMNMPQAKDAAESIRAGDIKDESVRLIEAVQNPTDTAGVVRGLMFTHFIGGSVASALVNVTQPVMMTLPWLSQWGGAAKAAARLMASARQAASGKIADSETAEALKRAEKEGVVSPQEIHHLTAEAMASWGKNPVLKRLAFIWGAPFAVAEQFNRRVTFLAAYQTAKAEGIADPFAFAHDAIIETQGLYNKGNAPNWARNPIGATALTFKQYSIHYLEWIRRMWNAGEPGSRERTEGRKAVLFAMALLFMAGGSEGLPFAEDLNDLADTIMQALGFDTSARGWKREFLARTLGMGDTGADVVMRGMSALPGIPLDVSIRMGMGNLLPATGMLLKSNTDVSGDVLELAGPVGALLKQYKDAGRKALDGNLTDAALGMLPGAMQNAGKAASMWMHGEARDAKGRRIMATDEIDAVMKLIGFQPAELARENARISEQDKRIKLTRAVESSIADQWAQGLRERDVDMVNEARQQLAEWNASNPESRIAINSAQIKRRLKEMQADKADRFARTAPKELRGSVMEALR